MFDHRHYVPILKGKEGEYLSLRDLDLTVRIAFTPLIEVPQIPWDHQTESPAKTVDEHLRNVATRVVPVKFCKLVSR